jgi:hypothetical protein
LTDFDPGRVGTSPGPLQAGQRYLLRVLLKQGTGEAHLDVAARQAGSGDPLQSLAGSVIGTFINPDAGVVNIKAQPQNVTKRIGERASFSVDASSQGGDLFYQWSVNGVEIPGATRASYTTPVLTASDHGKQYRVAIGVAGSTTLSAPATLTVTGPAAVPTVEPYIGVNFTGGGTGGAAGILQPEDVAGAAQQSNFNNLGGTAGTDVPLVDHTGAPSPVMLTFQATTLSFTGAGDLDADRALLQGYIHANSAAGVVTLTLTSVPDDTYNFYVYSLGFNFNSIFDTAFSLAGATTPPTFHVTAQHAGEFVLAPGLVRMSSTDPDMRDKGNYVVFESVQPDAGGSMTVTVTSEATVAGITYMPAVCGFQLARVNVQPALAIERSGGGVVVSWQDDAAGYTLESSATVGAGAMWAPVASVPNPITGAGSVPVSAVGAARFYQLRK